MGRERTRISKKVNKLAIIHSKAMKMTAETILKRTVKKRKDLNSGMLPKLSED